MNVSVNQSGSFFIIDNSDAFSQDFEFNKRFYVITMI